MERLVLALIVLAVCVHAGPIQKISVDTCARTCTGNSKFNYVVGKTYQYKYDADIKTGVQGASEDNAKIHMSATVEMEVISKCDLVMRLNDVTLTEYDPIDLIMKETSSEFRSGLEKAPIRISFQDGNIEELCLKREEPNWVLNAKRGILSMFQNNMDDFSTNKTVSETDVSGVCDTEYHVSKSGWYKTTVSKSKNLLGCTDRTGYNTAVQGVPYTAASGIQSLPVVKSNHNCEHEIDIKSHILHSATCNEQHMFLPFSRSDSGAVTYNTQTLKFVKVTTGIKSPFDTSTRKSMKFDHINDAGREAKSRKDITRKLIEICEKTKSGVRPETPRLFTDLVFMMKTVDSDTLADTYKLLQEGAICTDNKERTRKFFLDALPIAGSSSSLHLMTQLLTTKAVTGIEADMWLSAISFLKNPTKDMLKEVKPLINMKDTTDKALLSVGTLIHSYCLRHGNCERDDMVKAVISAMQNKIAKGCKIKPDNFKTSLLALRGIGNAGYAVSAIPTLEICVKITSNPIEIRLSAIEAFRRMPCDASRKALVKTFLQKEEDSEVRIAAYRVLMECPSPQFLSLVRSTLESEEINQVGSYIWSHLTNLMETSDRHKQDIRAILEDETFKKEFDLDKRKFSRNYEGSMFIEKLNAGGKVEGDLVWSSRSFVPRSAMMNFTVDLFGHSINLLEFGGRAEGIEYFLESFFGPNGYFSGQDTKGGNDMLANGIKQEKMKKIDNRYGSKMDELRGSMYMRVFGNELRYKSFQGVEDLMSGPNFNLFDMLIQLAKDNDYTFSHSTMFLDTSIIIPTGAGFPMNLTVNGTATIDLRMKGKMDLRSPPAVSIAGLVQPSAAIDISSMMSVDAFVTKSGIKMVSTLHSSTAVQGKFQVNEAGVISAEYEMPQPKMEIIDVKSSFFTVHRDMEKEQKMIADNIHTKKFCSPEKLVTITGLELCAEVTYPNASLKSDAPYFPLTGPVTAGVYLYNRDTHKKYKMEARSTHNKASNILHFTFDTPESRIDRHIVLDLNLNKRATTIDMTLNSPWKKANLQGAITNDKGIMGINSKMSVDGKSGYSVNSKFVKSRVGNSIKYVPSLEISIPQMKPVSIRGMLMHNGYRQLDLEYDMSGLTAAPVSAQLTINNKPALKGVRGSLSLQKDKAYSFDTRVMISSDNKKIGYKPFVSLRSPTGEVLAFGGSANIIFNKKVVVDLVLDKVFAKAVTLKGFVTKTTKNRGRVIYNTKMTYTSSPVDLLLKAKIDNRNSRAVATVVDFTYVIRKIARNNIKLVSKVTNLSSKYLTKAKASANVLVKRNPELNLKFMGNLEHNKKHSEFDVDVRYGRDFKDENKHIDMSFEMNRKFKDITAASANLQTRLTFPGQGLNIIVKGNHKHSSKELDSNIFLRLGNGQPIESSLLIQDKTEQLVKVVSEYKLSYPGREVIFNHTLAQTDKTTFVSSFKSQLEKNGKNTIITTLKTYPDKERVSISSDLKLSKQTPVHLQGDFDFNPADFITSMSYEKDLKKYSGSLTSLTKGTESSSLTIDLQHPERRIVMDLSGKSMMKKYQVEADLKWNAGRNDSENVHISSWIEPPTEEKLNGSITITYPTRTLTLNAHQLLSDKYNMHADFTWETDKKVTMDTIVLYKNNMMINTLKLTSPFSKMRRLDLAVNHKDDHEEYATNVEVKWNKGESVTSELILKKPASLKTVVGSVFMKTSFKVLKKIRLDVNHKLSDSLASSVKFAWNRQLINVDINLKNTTKGKKMGFNGNVDVKTSFAYLKKGQLKISHDNNGKTFNTLTTLMKNKKTYKIDSKITHIPTANKYENTGAISISAPTGKSDIVWSHMHTSEKVTSMFASSQGKKGDKNITVRLNGEFKDLYAASLSIQTPYKSARDALLEVSMKHDGYVMVDSKANVNVNGAKVAAATISYNLESPAAITTLNIPALDINCRIQGNATAEKNSQTVIMEVVLTPEISMVLSASQKFFDVTGNPDAFAQSLISWKSSFPGYEHAKFVYEISDNKDESSVTTHTKLEYSQGKVIEVKSELDKNSYYSSLATPYESLPFMEGKISFVGKPESFRSSAFIKILPVLEKTSASVSWSTLDGLKTELRVDTPSTQYPYIQVNLEAKKTENGKTTGDLVVEYLPRETVRVEVMSDISDIVNLSAKVTSPFVTIDLYHSGNLQSFKSSAEIEGTPGKKYGLIVGYTNGTTIEGYATISVPGRRDINAVFSHQGSAMNFITHAEITHNRMNQFTSDFKFAAGNSITVSASTSLRSLLLISEDKYRAAFTTKVIPLKKMSAHGEFVTTTIGKSEADVSFDLTKDIEGSLTVKSPLIKNIEASFNHHQSEKYINSRAEIVHDGKKNIDVQASLNVDEDSVVGEIGIKSPLSDDIQVLSRFDGGKDNFVVHFEGSVGVNKSEIDLSHKWVERNSQQTISVRSTGMKDVTAEISNTGDYYNLRSYAELNHGLEKHRIDSTFKHLIGNTEGSISISSPLGDLLSTNFFVKVTEANLESNVELNIGSDKSEVHVSVGSKPNLEGSIRVNSPYVTDVSAGFDHTGEFPNIVSHAQVNIANKDIVDVKLMSQSTERGIAGSFALQTPLKNYSSIETSFFHQGMSNNFRSHGDFAINSDKSEINLFYSSMYKYEGMVSIKSHLIDDLKIGFEHDGTKTNFDSHGEISVGFEKYELDVNANVDSDVILSMIVKSPRNEDIIARFSHSGNFSDFRCHAELMHDKDSKWEGDVSFSAGDEIRGEIVFKPCHHLHEVFIFDSNIKFEFSKYHAEINGDLPLLGEVLLNFKRTGELNDFNIHADASFRNKKSDADVTFQLAKKLLSSSVNLRFPHMEDVSFSFNHNGGLKNFNTKTEMTIGQNRTQGAVRVRITGSSIYSNLAIQSHYMDRINVNFNHNGQFGDFTTSGDVTIGNMKNEADMAFHLSGKVMSSSASVKSPLMDSVSIDFNHNGAPTDFTTKASVTIGDKKNEGDLTFQITEKAVISSLNIKSPYMDNINANFNHEGFATKFTTKADVTIGVEKSEGDVSFQWSNTSTTISGNLKSPSMEDITFNQYTLSMPTKYTYHQDYSVGDAKTETDMMLDYTNLKATFALTSPKTSLNFDHSGDIKNFISALDLTTEMGRYSSEAKFTLNDNVEASFKLTSPVEGMESISALYTHNGKPSNFRCHGELSLPNKANVADLIINVEQLTNMKGSLQIKSEIIPDFTAKFSNILTETSLQSMSEISVDDEVLYGVAVSFTNNSFLKAELEVKTPVTEYRVIRLSGINQMDKDQVKASAELLIGSDSSVMELSFSSKPNVVGVFELRSVYLPHLKATIDATGTPTNFRGNSELIFDGEKKGSVDASFNMEGILDANLKMELPLENYTRINGDISIRSSSDLLDIKSALSIEDRELVDGSVRITNQNQLSGEISLKSIYINPLTVSFEFSGDLKDFSTTADISYNNEKLAASSMKFNFNPTPLKTSGFASFNKMSFAYSLDNAPKDFKSHAEVKVEEKMWSLDATCTRKQDIDASFKVIIPEIDPISGKLSHSQRQFRCASHVELKTDSSTKYQYDMLLKWRRALEGTFSVKTPIKGMEITKVVLNHDGTFPNIKSSAEVNFNKTDISAAVSLMHGDLTKGDVSIKTPFEGLEDVSVTFYSEGDIEKFQAGGKVLYAPGKDIEAGVEHSLSDNKLQSRIHFMSPFTDEIVVSANHTGVPMNFVSSYELAMGSDNRIKSETSLKTGFQYVQFKSSVTTTMSGETFVQKVELKHDGAIEKFKTEAMVQAMEKLVRVDTSFQLEPVIEGSASIITPFFEKSEEIKVIFSHSGSTSGFLSTGELQYSPNKKISGKIDFLNNGWRRRVATVEVRTPFKGMEVNKVTYQHTGNSDSFDCDADIFVASQPLSATFKGSKAPLSMDLNIKSPFEGYESFGLNGNFLNNTMGRYSGRMEASWHPNQAVIFESSFAALRNKIEGSASLTTPFVMLQRSSIEFSHQELSQKFIENLKATFNGSRIVDVEVDHSLMNERKHAIVTIRAPRSMKFDMSGDFTLESSAVDASANWNTEDSKSNLKLEGVYDIRTDKRMNFKLTRPGQVISYSGLLDRRHSKSDLVWGIGSTQKAGYEVAINDYDSRLKLILPTRSLELTGSHRSKVTEGSFLWDADVDETKKVGFRSVIVPSDDAIKADITFQLPSLGKRVQVGSEVVVNRGRVIFDGKTEFSYSPDERKKIVFSSRLEDKSLGATKNYSFSMGLSHPYTTVDIKLASHVGKSKNRYSAGMGLEYLNTHRQTKTYQVNGQINKLRKTISFELQSPVKSISISGSAQTEDKFRVSILNIYDQKMPLTTVFTVDPATRSLDFYINYDLENPSSEFHINAKYVNSSALAAEVFHIVNRERVTDILVTARLNNSHLLHTRVHWRPEMIKEYETVRERKLEDYKRRLEISAVKVEAAVIEETVEKFKMIWEAVVEEIGQDNALAIEAAVIPMFEDGLRTYAQVQGHVQANFLPFALDLANITQYKYNRFVQTYREFSQAVKLPETMKDLDFLSSARQPLEKPFNYALDLIKIPAKHLPTQVTGALKYPAKYMFSNMDMDTAMLEQLNKNWELEHHLESVIETILLAIEEEAEEGILKLKSIILNSAQSPITVYDPTHGEIQAEFHSPIPLKSLDELPVINIERYINMVMKTRSRKTENVPSKTAEWLPPFTGVASITSGHKITTFDGYIYDLDADCTFVLVRDFRNGNFSIILNNNDGTTLSILSHGKPIEIKQSGEISVAMEPVTLPYKENNITITSSDDGIISIDGANHFKVDYDLSVDHIDVEINGWYYGKTAGLLGTFDNEPSNDLMTSFGKIINNPKRFARTWDVGNTNCR